MIRFLLSVLFATYSALSMFAQTEVWELVPGRYDRIERIGDNLFVAFAEGKAGLITSDGKELAANGVLGEYYEGRALYTSTDAMGERVLGCVTADGRYYSFKEPYYTLMGQKFFSDGLLSVKNADGKPGYVDDHGVPVVGFDGKYIRIKPFTEGYAAVYSGKKYHLIDKEGVPVRFRFPTVGVLQGGTNVFDGVVYVWDTEGKFYTMRPNENAVCKKVSRPSNTEKDYLSCFKSVTGREKTVPFVRNEYRMPNDGIELRELNGKCGIIRHVSDQSFTAYEESKKPLVFHAGETVTCAFTLDVPQVWNGKRLAIRLLADDGTAALLTEGMAGKYSFQISPENTCSKSYKLTVQADGLMLLNDYELMWAFEKKYRCASCGKDTDVCPYSGKHPLPKVDNSSKKETKRERSSEPVCKTCGKKLSECTKGGVHY